MDKNRYPKEQTKGDYLKQLYAYRSSGSKFCENCTERRKCSRAHHPDACEFFKDLLRQIELAEREEPMVDDYTTHGPMERWA